MRKTAVLRRPFSGDPDIEKMAALVRAYPGDNLHLVDLPYRVCSPALDDPNNVGLWTDGEGNVVAWAVLQTPFWTLDYAYVPDVDRDLHRRILAWGDRRAREVVGTPSGHPAWFVNVLSGQEARIPDLESAGFACQASVPVDPWTDVLAMARYPGTDSGELSAGRLCNTLSCGASRGSSLRGYASRSVRKLQYDCRLAPPDAAAPGVSVRAGPRGGRTG